MSTCSAGSVFSGAGDVVDAAPLVHAFICSSAYVTLGGSAINSIPQTCAGASSAAVPSSACAVMMSAFVEVFSSAVSAS